MAKKIMISIDENVLERLDSEAQKIGVSRSGFIATALGEYINQRENANSLVKSLFNNESLMNLLKEKIVKNE